MGEERTAWHVVFTDLLAERAPPVFEVRPEVLLAMAPQRADLLLLRRAGVIERPRTAEVLRGLWPLLGDDTVMEFKSVGRPFRRGDLVRLLSYGVQYHVTQVGRLRPRQLTLVLIVPNMTSALRTELGWMELGVDDRGDGYMSIYGRIPYALYVVEIDRVAETERDELLGSFGNRPVRGREASSWWTRHWREKRAMTRFEDLDGYDETLDRLLEVLTPEERLRGLRAEEIVRVLPAEQLLRALPAEERLRTLNADEHILGMRDDLRLLPEEALAKLSAAVRAEVKRRIGG